MREAGPSWVICAAVAVCALVLLAGVLSARTGYVRTQRTDASATLVPGKGVPVSRSDLRPASPGNGPRLLAQAEGQVSLSQAILENYEDSLTLAPGGDLYLFGFSSGGNERTSGFALGSYATGTDRGGDIATGLAVTTNNSDNFSTEDRGFTIAGVGVSGVAYYGDTYDLYVPPAQPVTDFNYTFSLPESALVVLIVTSPGCCQSVSGIGSLAIDAQWSGPGGNGLTIASAALALGSYTVSVSSWNFDQGSSTTYADLVGVFAFSNQSSGFIHQSLGGGPSSPTWMLDPLSFLFGIGIGGLGAGLVVAYVIPRTRTPKPPS